MCTSSRRALRHQPSKIEHIRQFRDKSPFLDLSGGGSSLIVDQEEITQRLVDEIESDIALNGSNGAVVLDEGV